MSHIHPTAIIDPNATLGKDVEIGPYCMVGPNVVLGDRCVLKSHVTIEGYTTIGSDNIFYQFSVVGVAPQDLKYHGEKSTLEIGSHNCFREAVSLHVGTEAGGGKTVIGDHNLMMGNVHIAHDCIVGSHNVIANDSNLSGHVIIDDYTTIGGMTGVIQFIRIGSYAYIGAATMVEQHVLPFTRGHGNRMVLKGINFIGMERKGYSKEAVRNVKQMHKLLCRSALSQEEAIQEIETTYPDSKEAQFILDFVRTVEGPILKKT